MSHTLIAFLIQIAAYLLTGDLFIGATASSFYLLGREYAQAEQRVIQSYYGNKRANAPWWCGVELRAWTTKGFLDWIVPSLSVFIVAFIVRIV